MARPIRNIDIYLPLDDNDGQPIPGSKYGALQQELLNRFGGVTSVQRQFPLQGVWRSEYSPQRSRLFVSVPRCKCYLRRPHGKWFKNSH